ncbi:MAG: hypothetical protein A3I00_03570 [Betaproteobacteria bacterium RIFCSPLOWO2_02_FULL_64_12]|nr:MAG: hypothetical protein A3I00_03570 [Betaproteobacteria bacterium RIFCSPLOWO2_02_FULL_64_12]
MPKRVAIDAVAIAEEVGRRGVVREGVHDLLGRPGDGGVLGDVEVEDAAAVVSQHDEDAEDAQLSRGNGEEVDRDEVVDVVGQERPPGLRRGRTSLGDEPRDGALGHVEAELQHFGMNSRSTPEGIRGGHLPGQGGDLAIDGRPAASGPAGELGPVLAESAPLPPADSIGGHDHEGLPPAGPDPGQPDPKEPISWP